MKNYEPKIPTNTDEAYWYNRWWIDHVNSGKVIGGKYGGVKSKGKQLTAAQKESRKRFFIVQAQQKKKANEQLKFGIPTSSQHARFFRNHTGSGGGKAKAKTKHIDPGYQVPSNQDPDEGPAPKVAKTSAVPRQSNWDISPTPSPDSSRAQTPAAAPTAEPQQPAEDPNILETVMASENDIPMEPDQSGLAADMDVGGGGAGGGGGVGNSTGNWTNETVFAGKTIITNASRHCVCLNRDNDHYKMIYNGTNTQENNQTDKSGWIGFTTPWNYLDFNQNAVHFSPRDWQHLVNNYSRWRPRAVHIKIFNIQVVQRTTTADSTLTFANDLTGTIQVFADQANRYPKLMYPNQTTMMGPFPNMIYYLPQYGYLTNGGPGNAGRPYDLLDEYSQFYCLDEHPSVMLRTGNTWEGHFQFGADTGWISNRRTTRPITRRMNPNYDTWQVNAVGGDAKSGTYDTWRSPWLTGPWMELYEAADNTTISNNSHVYVGQTAIPLNPGPPIGRPTNKAHCHLFWVSKVHGMNEGDVNEHYINPSTAVTVRVDNSGSYAINPSSAYKLRASSDTGGDNGSATHLIKSQAIMPGMIWDDRIATYWDNIWQEYPESDNKFMPHGRLGGVYTDAAPGHVYVKLTPKPTGEANAIIDQYATFTVTVSIEWEAEPYTCSQWNMRKVISYDSTAAKSYDGFCDSDGNYIVGANDRNVETLYTAKVNHRVN
nr:MAG: capsid protein [Aveparvovirus sp.]